MTSAELKEELRALDDLHQRMAERYETLSRRLIRHFDAESGGGKTDYWNLPRKSRWIPIGRRDDEDDGSD